VPPERLFYYDGERDKRELPLLFASAGGAGRATALGRVRGRRRPWRSKQKRATSLRTPFQNTHTPLSLFYPQLSGAPLGRGGPPRLCRPRNRRSARRARRPARQQRQQRQQH
jgi:hypothetical protein